MSDNNMKTLAASIAPCDKNKPYWYVCYSTRDGELVYQDVLALQEQGKNVWIDVDANFNTGEGYNSTIFSAIANENCQGLLLYFSEQSATSAQSAKEVAYTSSRKVLDLKGKALPIIAVEMKETVNHDLEHWVYGELYAAVRDEMLSPAERERIEKYCKKYNNKLNPMTTKFELCETIIKAVMDQSSGQIDYTTDQAARVAAIAKVLA